MKYQLPSRISSGMVGITLSTALCFNLGCGKDLSPQEQLQQYYQTASQHEETHKSHKTLAYSSFENACLDNIINIDEQKAIFSHFDLAKKARDNFIKNNKRNAPEEDSTGLEWTEKDESYWELLNENINGYDVFTPEFQKYLKEKGVNVKVDKYFSQGESDSIVDALNAVAEILGSLSN